MLNALSALYRYRSFILGSVAREFRLRYTQSALGGLWAILNPLAMIVIYTVIFAEVMRAKLPGIDNKFAYSIFLCAGVFSWSLFAELVGKGQTVFIENANLLKKMSFPRLCLPMISVLSGLLNYVILYCLFVAFLFIASIFPGAAFLAIVPLTILVLALGTGLGIFLGILNVFYRDVGHFFGIFLQFWFWLTPIVYPARIIPDSIRPLLQINPMTPVVEAFQGILVSGRWPDWSSLIVPSAIAIVLCVLGWSMFRARAGDMVDEL